MLKYIDKIDSRKNYFLSLIDYNDKKTVDCNYKLPLSFYEKYSNIFKISDNYIKVFKNIDIINYFQNNLYKDYESYKEAGDIVELYYSIEQSLNESLVNYNRIDFDVLDLKLYLDDVIKILNLLINIYPHNKEIYKKSLKEITAMYKCIKEYSTIEYNKTKYKKIYLPDSWFILPNNTLYNTGNGHKGTSLVYDLYKIKDLINNNKSLIDYPNNFKKIKEKIIQDGFTEYHFKKYLNYSYSASYLDKTHEFPTGHDPNILNHILGVINAQIYFYNFFKNLQMFTSNPSLEFNKIIQMTTEDIVDIFVRCCGFHKIESTLDKTITTSCINYKKEFSEYIAKGWHVYFIPPIIIQKDLGTIAELNIESPIIKKYLKQKR